MEIKVDVLKTNQIDRKNVFERKYNTMHKFLILFSVCLIGFGCTKNQSELIKIPNNLELDIDQDGNADFIVVYSQQTEGDPIGNYEAIRMNLESTDDNQVLKNEDKFPMFLNEIGSIQTEVNPPLYWEITNPSSNISTPIATIRTDYDETTWGDEWRVFDLEQKESYLIGFKLLGGNTAQVGFIEFSVNTQTGEFILLKTEFL
ncbi:MAG: hypothetical protein ACPGVB_04170 [Chitinophagales bacterium]